MSGAAFGEDTGMRMEALRRQLRLPPQEPLDGIVSVAEASLQVAPFMQRGLASHETYFVAIELAKCMQRAMDTRLRQTPR